MKEQYQSIEALLRNRAELNARLRLLPYDGSPEVKEKNGNRYIYIRKRVGSRLTSTYVDIYSDILYETLLRNAAEAREIRKALRKTEKELAAAGYEGTALSGQVLNNLDFARVNMKTLIYDQAVLEGVGATFPQTEEILENGKVYGVTVSDVQKIVNLKHAWEFILNEDVIAAKTDFSILSHIATLVNEGLITDGGRIRSVPVTIGGTAYTPPLPIESAVRESIADIMSSEENGLQTAIRLCLYCMKAQIFRDGNKRAAVLFANHYLIGRAGGLLVLLFKLSGFRYSLNLCILLHQSVQPLIPF